MRRNDGKRRWRPGVLLGAALALALGALILAGCGGSSGGSSTSSSTAAGASGSESAAGAGSSEGSGSGTEGEPGPGGEAGPGGHFQISEEAKACLQEQGVELPGFKGGEGGKPPAGGPGGEGFEKMKEALKACGVEGPQGGFGAKGGEGGPPNMNSAAFKGQVEKYVACVRENGFEMPEPNFSGEGPVFEKSVSESAAFKKASASCQGLLGGPKGGPGSEGGGET